MSAETPIGLPETIRSLRAELSQAMEEGADKGVQFRVGPVELEFLVEVTREIGGEGGIKFLVVSVGAKGSVVSAATHRIKLSLHPVTGEGEDVTVSDAVPGRPR